MTSRRAINTDTFSQTLRERSVDLAGRRLLVSRLSDSRQESDITEPLNCNGYGRLRHFRRSTSPGWPPNPLPIDPAQRALGLERSDIVIAQVFQHAACNWRCWYCFVPFELLAGKTEHSAWYSADELMRLYIQEHSRAHVIDLSGGQPDLVPEWVPWMMDALESHGHKDDVFLWSDDNLSNDYYFRHLTTEQRERIVAYRNYGRVCCFKGFDDVSFAFNTGAAPELFARQFDLFGRLRSEGLDLYAYVTLTSPHCADIDSTMARFVDRLQLISERLPLRVVLLEVAEYDVNAHRIRDEHRVAFEVQVRARDAWLKELSSRFSSSELAASLNDITSVQL